jgi:hypothetical protein
MIASSLASRARFFLFLLRGSTRRKGRQFVTTSYLLLTRVFPGTYTLLKLKRNIFWWVSKQRVACQLLLCSRQYRMIQIQYPLSKVTEVRVRVRVRSQNQNNHKNIKIKILNISEFSCPFRSYSVLITLWYLRKPFGRIGDVANPASFSSASFEKVRNGINV